MVVSLIGPCDPVNTQIHLPKAGLEFKLMHVCVRLEVDKELSRAWLWMSALGLGDMDQKSYLMISISLDIDIMRSVYTGCMQWRGVHSL